MPRFRDRFEAPMNPLEAGAGGDSLAILWHRGCQHLQGDSVKRRSAVRGEGPDARTKAAAPDGRVQRGERNRDAIVDAMFELVGEGALEPTAEQVAARAGVGLRSVFRHFTDMESLYAALTTRLRREVEPIVTAEQAKGSLAERARAMVQRRARLFERIAPYKRSGNLNRERSPFLNAEHAKVVLQLREHLALWLPELATKPRATRDAIELVASFEAWDRLCRDQGLSSARARAAQEAALLALLGER
jgi:AcrR family transcriptional regulator